MNAPQLYERFIIPAGKRKVEVQQDTKVMNAATFTVLREDHTLGNMIRMCAGPTASGPRTEGRAAALRCKLPRRPPTCVPRRPP